MMSNLKGIRCGRRLNCSFLLVGLLAWIFRFSIFTVMFKAFPLPCLFLLLVLFSTCKKEDLEQNISPGTIENRTFNSTVLIDGHDFDETVIKNCTFEDIDGDGLQIRDVNNLCIENCTFRNIGEDGIRFRNSGGSDGVKILNNTLYNIKENGILAAEGHTNTLIKGNKIYNVATSNTSSQFGAPHHGIYFQGLNVRITENTIHDIVNDQGNCVSIRTHGSIDRNTLYGATDHGISYFSDHPGAGGNLLIENNFIYDNGKRAINLSSNGDNDNHIDLAHIRFNTLISDDKSTIGIDDNLNDIGIQIEANIAIRTDGGSTYIYTGLPINPVLNITNSGDLGFVDYTGRDLHLSPGSVAVDSARSANLFPEFDFDGDVRLAGSLDVGADEL